MDPEKTITPVPPVTLDTAQATLDRARAFSAKLPKVNTINANDLETPVLTAPPVVPATGFAGLAESTKAAIAGLAPKVEEGAKDIQSVFDTLGSQETRRQDALGKAGVPEKEAEFRRLTSTMNQKDLASRRRVEKIRGENVTGQLSEGQTIAISNEERRNASEMADLAIVAAFARDDFELAQSVVNDRIDAETEDLNNELRSLEFFYSQNFNQLSDERKTQLLQQTAEVEREISEKESRLKEVGAIQLAAAENGAPGSVITSIGNSTDLTTAITAAGKFIDQTIERGPGDSDDGIKVVDLSPDDERDLTGAGYSLPEIEDLQRTVAEFGIDATLAQITDPRRKAAVKKVFEVAEPLKTRADAEAKVAELGIDTILNTLYSPEELKEFADAAGISKWYKSKGFDIKNYFKSEDAKTKAVEAYVQKFKKEGIFNE